ncbi:hypothetical protein BJP36_40410 [Moorena producens JHB]|uniref:Uncharacterized protein n=1 Tax=Moorena producens (strain JHB) TaxID=1454205 RepID=A0A9Q9SS40_MOOP1|nr:hypothetical protein [Moorena producens]WAN68639.1 hypothetical protein BJP36_40410 [Moorena producens JHB]
MRFTLVFGSRTLRERSPYAIASTTISQTLPFIPDSQFPTPDSRFSIPDSRFPIPDSQKLPILFFSIIIVL